MKTAKFRQQVADEIVVPATSLDFLFASNRMSLNATLVQAGIVAGSDAEVTALVETVWGFSRTLKGKAMTVSDDGICCRRSINGIMESVVLGDRALDCSDSGTVGFSIRVTDVTTSSDYGLLIGFTTGPPRMNQQLPRSADLVEQCWLVGLDGAVCDGWTGSASWSDSGFFPNRLAENGLVAITAVSARHVTSIIIHVNGVEEARHDTSIPSASVLFALVDLCGNTLGIAMESTRPAEF